jgi:hypothetical protein
MGLRPGVFGCIMPVTVREAAMGGVGSGAGRSKHIGNVEDVLSLDIRALRRLEVVRPGECVCDTVRWSIDGRSAPSVRLRVDLDDIERGGAITITGNMPDGAIRQRVAIEAVVTRFGGWRCYFVCPFTTRRCEVLYYAAGRFASRQAQRLSYAVQSMTDLSRAHRKAAKLRSQLRGSEVRPRPRGYNRIALVERFRDADRKARTLYVNRLRTSAERSGTRMGPATKR